MEKIDITQASRIDVIEALRSQVHSDMFHETLKMPTPALKALLVFFQEGGDADNLPKLHNDVGVDVLIHWKDKEKFHYKLYSGSSLEVKCEETTINGGTFIQKFFLKRWLPSLYGKKN